MRYFKCVSDGIIQTLGTGNGGAEITEEEYNFIMSILGERPKRDGYYYLLRGDLTWEEHEREPEPEEDIPADEALSIILGGAV